jgi:flagellar hook-basal body complex protein FliE
MDPVSMRVASLDAKVTLSEGAKMLARQAPAAGATSFADAIKQALSTVNASQNSATALAQQFQMGSTQVSLEDSVIAAQKASLSFQAAVQFRNRVVQAYQDIMNMNV